MTNDPFPHPVKLRAVACAAVPASPSSSLCVIPLSALVDQGRDQVAREQGGRQRPGSDERHRTHDTGLLFRQTGFDAAPGDAFDSAAVATTVCAQKNPMCPQIDFKNIVLTVRRIGAE